MTASPGPGQEFGGLKPPAGIETFRKFREEGHRHVDKTPFIQQPVEEGARYFLPRPRRFG